MQLKLRLCKGNKRVTGRKNRNMHVRNIDFIQSFVSKINFLRARFLVNWYGVTQYQFLYSMFLFNNSVYAENNLT